ncbi:MAG TPA: hypothetical protein VMF06_23335 [Candidatus Limnocylindria bacterium]|jgi:hypothetical protein|nr:hypothetical protein [Candidatus Limnocylindria bacterium]
MSSPEQAPPFVRWRKRLVRLAISITIAIVLARLCGVAMTLDAQTKTPPGLFRGMLHGALMPMTWPALLSGHDQEIYATNNEGRLYKLGYSWGVNVSGLIFFGWFFFTVGGIGKKQPVSKADPNKPDTHSPAPQ